MKTKKQKIKISFIVFGLFIVAGVFGFGKSVRAQVCVLNYGFEDWTGDAETTPGYPFTNSDQSYWDIHTACTEVVTSYNADDMGQIWTSHSGYNYLLFDRSATTELEPPVSGISATSVNSRSNLGVGLNFGGLNKLNLADAITTGEVFIRFWARFNKGHYGEFSGNPYPGMKFIRIHNNDPENTADIFMSLNCNHGISPLMYLWQTSSGGSHGSMTIPDAYDGNWHKFSMYVDFNNGVVKQWYDVNEETLNNADQTWDNNGQIGAATHITFISLNGNFAAKYPLDEIYSAIDDIEIWDGIPNASGIRENSKNTKEQIRIYPNPFKEISTIEYVLPEASNVIITLYNSQGQKVKTIVNSFNNAGNHKATLNVNDLPAGIYYFKIDACGSIHPKKCVLIR